MSRNILLKKKEETAKGGHVNPLLAAYETLNSAKRVLYQAQIMQISPTCGDVLEFIDAIVANSEDINVKSKEGYGILHIFSYPKVIRKVVKLGGNINLPMSSSSFSPLSFFIHKFCMDVKQSDKKFNRFYNTLKLYLELGADVNAGGGATILMTATLNMTDKERKNVVKVLDLLYSYGADFNHVFKGFGCSPLGITRDPELIRYLTQHGADPNKNTNIKTQYLGHMVSTTPLWDALKTMDTAAVEALLEAGADPNLRSDIAPIFALLTPSYFMNDENVKEIKKLLSLLVDYGADLNTTDGFGHTILTVNANKYLPVETLVKLGADAAYVAPDGNTPLHRVAKKSHPIYTGKNYFIEDVYALLNAGANINAKNDRGETPFALACETYEYEYRTSKKQYFQAPLEVYADFLKALVREGADIKALTKEGNVALEKLPEKLRKELEEIAEYRETLRNTIDNEVEMYER